MLEFFHSSVTKFSLLLLALAPLSSFGVEISNFDSRDDQKVRKLRAEVYNNGKFGRQVDLTKSDLLNDFDSFSETSKGHYEKWKTPVSNLPLVGRVFGSAKGNYSERIEKTYRSECTVDQRLARAGGQIPEDLESVSDIAGNSVDPFDRGTSLGYLGHLRNFRGTIECADAKRRSLRTVPQNWVKIYFSEDEIDHRRFYYVANVSHRDGNGESFYVARIPKLGVDRVMLHQVNFGTGMKKLEEAGLLGAAHFQMRLDFSEDVILRKQRIVSGQFLIEGIKVSTLVHSVEANGGPGFKYSLGGGFMGIISEELNGRFLNTFRMKTLETVIYDSVLAREGMDRLDYSTLQFPVDLAPTRRAHRAKTASLLSNIVDQANAMGEHTSYNTLERSCSVWGFENLDRDNVLNHKHFGSIKEHLPHKLKEALEERRLLLALPDSKTTGMFRAHGFSNGGEYFNLHHEVCDAPEWRELFDDLNCELLGL